MNTWFCTLAAFLGLIIAGQSTALSSVKQPCSNTDKACREFARLATAEQFDAIVAKVDPNASYSETAREHIGMAYLMMAGRETNTPQQEEAFCLKALEYGAVSAYMGLYFIHAQSDPEKALGYLKKYVATGPQDGVPYAILGEAEFEKQNYAAANTYLTTARKVARGRSSNVDWLLFQSSYLTGNYAAASVMLDNAFAQGKTVGDLKALINLDPRFAEIVNQPEFKRIVPIINGRSTGKLYSSR